LKTGIILFDLKIGLFGPESYFMFFVIFSKAKPFQENQKPCYTEHKKFKNFYVFEDIFQIKKRLAIFDHS